MIMLQSMIHLCLALDDLAATHAGLTVINVSEWEILTAGVCSSGRLLSLSINPDFLV